MNQEKEERISVATLKKMPFYPQKVSPHDMHSLFASDVLEAST